MKQRLITPLCGRCQRHTPINVRAVRVAFDQQHQATAHWTCGHCQHHNTRAVDRYAELMILVDHARCQPAIDPDDNIDGRELAAFAEWADWDDEDKPGGWCHHRPAMWLDRAGDGEPWLWGELDADEPARWRELAQ